MEPDPTALADMTRAIDESIRSLPKRLSYIVLSRYMPPSAVLLEHDDRGRLYAVVSEETVDRLERVQPAPGDVAAYHGIPVVRVAA